MTHLNGGRRALFFALISLWVVCTGLHIYRLTRGVLTWPDPQAAASKDANGHPTLSGAFASGEPLPRELGVGDRLIRAGAADLRGVGPIRFPAYVLQEADVNHRVRLEYVHDGRARSTWIELRPNLFQWRYLPLTVSFALSGVLVLLRASGSRSAQAFFLANVVYSFLWLRSGTGPAVHCYIWIATSTAASALAPPLLLRAALLLPEEAAPVRRSGFAWIWIFSLLAPAQVSWFLGFPFSSQWGLRIGLILWTLFGGALLVVLTRNYRRAGPIGRRQVKWVVYGLYVGSVPVIIADVVGALRTDLWWLSSLSSISLVLIPICIVIAIVGFNLYDIDRIISATATYTVLCVIVLTAALTILPRASSAASHAFGIDPSSGQLALSVALASFVVPWQRRLRPQIERLFFAERHALERGIEGLLRELSSCETPSALLTLAGERLDALLRPDSCVIYGQTPLGYAPLFVRGLSLPPSFGPQSTLPPTLRGQSGAVDIETWRHRKRTPELTDLDWASLDGLGTVILLPFLRGDSLAGFVSLGAKRSGDVYTSTDAVLLSTVSNKLSTELLRFDAAEILRQERAMQSALRRYVPESLAAKLATGDGLETARREVSVLFVDIRGYTTYSEGRQAEEIFSTINRYTETVSRVVSRYGGTVVEFTGDGVMALFGAPAPLVNKEEAASAAGREIVAAVQALAVEGPGLNGQLLAVGVGIATGEAVVGNIQSADRLIWTAIGNTPNLAARLQSVTRQLDAAIVIDEATWKRARTVTAGFEKHEGVEIRGRRQVETVYALPLAVSES